MNVARTRMACSLTDEGRRHTRQPGEGIKYLRSIFWESPEGVCITDVSSRVVVWNRAAAAITGYETSEMLGRPCALEETTFKLEPFGQVEPSIRRALGEGPLASACDLCIENRSRDGTRLNISCKVIPLGHTDVACLILIAQNFRSPSELGNRLDSPIDIRPPALTPREYEILDLLAAGQTAKPIATALSLALPTVRTHIQNLLRKLEVHSCLEAVARYYRVRKGRP